MCLAKLPKIGKCKVPGKCTYVLKVIPGTTQHCVFQAHFSHNQTSVWLFRIYLKLIPPSETSWHLSWSRESPEGSLYSKTALPCLYHAVLLLTISPPAARAEIQNYRSSCAQYGGTSTISWKHFTSPIFSPWKGRADSWALARRQPCCWTVGHAPLQ